MDATTLPRPVVDNRQRWFVAGLILLFVGLSVQYSLKVLNHRSAFERWREQILLMGDGTDIQEKFNYPNSNHTKPKCRPASQPPKTREATSILTGFKWQLNLVGFGDALT